MKTTVTNWVMELTAQAHIHHIKVMEVVVSQPTYAQLITELTWHSRIKPTVEENSEHIDIVGYAGTVRVRKCA